VIARNRVGLVLAFALAGVTLIGAPLAIGKALDTPTSTTSTVTPAPSETTPSETTPSETTPSETTPSELLTWLVLGSEQLSEMSDLSTEMGTAVGDMEFSEAVGIADDLLVKLDEMDANRPPAEASPALYDAWVNAVATTKDGVETCRSGLIDYDSDMITESTDTLNEAAELWGDVTTEISAL